jgi:DNA modification methylase
MNTIHRVHLKNAKKMSAVGSETVALMVTSPPYPMIEMWDEAFIRQKRSVKRALTDGRRMDAFELMHQSLDPVWAEVHRVLVPGGIACINIGDATRTLKDTFTLYPNHARILTALLSLGFLPLPEILWRKQTNAPNKFMGSGMMPPGAYVTLEHEHILIVRKGDKREFSKPSEKRNRQASAFFWEERNQWFSDVWMDLKGTTQRLDDTEARKRSAAYPFDVPYRLITMFSVKGDLVLDPFLGTGTTMAAAMAAGRNSVGYELTREFLPVIHNRLETVVSYSNERIASRISGHREFVAQRERQKGPLKHRNGPYGFPVVTRQEAHLFINPLERVDIRNDTTVSVDYADEPPLS